MSFWYRLRAALASMLPDVDGKRGHYTPLFMLTMWIGCAVGIFALVLVAIQASDWTQGALRFGQCLLGMLASLSVGGFMGLLFGIPRIEGPSPGTAATTSRIRQNDSLEQIADWLTKTIVGVTLVRSEDVGRRLLSLSNAFSTEIFGLHTGRYVPGLATILSFATIGFLLAYVWARRYWVLEMLDTAGHLDGAGDPTLGRALQIVGEATQSEHEVPPDGLAALARTVKGWLHTPVPDGTDDPWRGRFGGQSVDSVMGRRLRVEFRSDPEAMPGNADNTSRWVQLRLVVESIDPSKPLGGKVRFFLHPTFPNPIREVPVFNGTAVVDLRARRGNFTVGTQTDGGACQLEQHIGSIAPGWVPRGWREAPSP